MPVWLRKFYAKKTEEALIEQKKAAEKTSKKASKITKPSIAPKPK